MLFALDIQHQGKPAAWRDRGAAWQGLREVGLTRAYADACDVALLAAGHDAVILADGSYSSRATRAQAYGAAAYVACHVNAGLGMRPGDRAELYHWPGSVRGQALAQAVADQLRGVVPWPIRILPADTDRTRATIQAAVPPALLFEPGFLDGAQGSAWLAVPVNLEAIGRALARGLDAWSRT